MVREELFGDDDGDGRDEVRAGRHADDVLREGADVLVPLGRDCDDGRLARAALLDVAERLVAVGPARGERHDGDPFV